MTIPSKNRRPLVSIITPSLNQAQFIEQTILSVKKQSYSAIEHIIIDGGSNDGTTGIIQKYARLEPNRIRWISKTDHGQAHAINKGFAMARGEIIGWLNSDDLYLHSNVIALIVTAFERMGAADIVYGHTVIINRQGVLLRILFVPKFNYSRLKRWCFISQPAVFFQRRIIDKDILKTSLHYSMDYEFWLRIGKKYCWHRMDYFLAADRNHPARKLIAQRTGSVNETQQLRAKINQKVSILVKLQDFLYKGWRRIGGVAVIWRSSQKHRWFPFLQMPAPFRLLRTQLLKKDYKLD
jgi:glycosyltransferase involved in cell wall biosynthesis